jgi:hypothetical protein
MTFLWIRVIVDRQAKTLVSVTKRRENIYK